MVLTAMVSRVTMAMTLMMVMVVMVVVRVSQKTLFLNFASFFESLVRMGVQRPQKKFQRYRPINDPLPAT